ncbi:MAG: HIT domain-containing protein [Ignavibacteriae bacterium]|nr:MAG: HIT domain-containing protein [Ignavibacteriota bacterium]
MDKLWSPWRSKYIDSFKPGNEKNDGCLFCNMVNADKDKENYIIHRSSNCFIVMNLYPYNSGHLMIVPYIHTSTLNDLDDETNLDCMKNINFGCELLKASIHPHGYNIGANLGRCSGAGIDGHIHFHIVPRWDGDTNFMPVFNDVKVVSEAMEDTYNKLKEALASIKY